MVWSDTLCASPKYCSYEYEELKWSVLTCHGGSSRFNRYSPSVTGLAGWAAGERVAGGGEELKGLIELPSPP